MYLVNEILVFTPGRRQEGLDRLAWIHSLMAPQPGFIQAIVAKYLGDATKHTVLRFWESDEAFQRFRETPDANYGRNRPEGLYTNEPVVPRWDSFLETNGSAAGNFLVKVQREVPEGGWDAFIAQQKQVPAVARSLGGLVNLRQFRAKDRSEALSVARFASRADFERLIESSEYGEVRQRLPEAVKLLATQCYEVVSEVGPK